MWGYKANHSAARQMEAWIEMLRNQNDTIKKRNLDMEFNLAKLKILHLSLKLKAEFGIDFE